MLAMLKKFLSRVDELAARVVWTPDSMSDTYRAATITALSHLGPSLQPPKG
jgi:hypothetical protein